MSTGERLSPGFPPIVPRIPDIDFISAILRGSSDLQRCKKNIKSKYHQIIVPLHPDN
jgi:hypothetical protein